MSQYLLPVKTGNEQFPVRYRNIFPGQWNPIYGILCEHNKVMYMLSEQEYNQYYPERDGMAVLYKMNLFTSDVSKVCNFTYSQLGSNACGSILVDDHMLYVSSGNNSTNAKILVFNLKKNSDASITDPLPLIGTYSYNMTNYEVRCNGKILWLNDHEIVVLTRSGFLFFDINRRIFSPKTYSSIIDYNDFAVGSVCCVATRNSTSSPHLFVYNYQSETYSTITLPTSNIACITYENGKFYIANNGKLYVYDEETMSLENTYNGAWGDPKTISVTNGIVFITVKSSNKLFIYDTTQTKQNSIYLPWTINGTNQIQPLAWEGFYFILQNTLGIINDVSISKYNFGPKYENMVIMLNKSNERIFSFDPKFVQFEDTFMTLRDGNLEYTLEPIETSSSIKSVSISKTDYKFLNQISIRAKERSDGE